MKTISITDLRDSNMYHISNFSFSETANEARRQGLGALHAREATGGRK